VLAWLELVDLRRVDAKQPGGLAELRAS